MIHGVLDNKHRYIGLKHKAGRKLSYKGRLALQGGSLVSLVGHYDASLLEFDPGLEIDNWPDLSGKGNHLTVTGVNGGPILLAAGQNLLSVADCRFLGIYRHIQLPVNVLAGYGSSQSISMFVVASFASLNSESLGGLAVNPSPSGTSFHFRLTIGPEALWDVFPDILIISGPATTLTAYHIYRLDFDYNTKIGRSAVDDSAYTTDLDISINPTPGKLIFGGADIKIAEVQIYNGMLDSATVTSILNDLNAKWAIF
jgi:hypothetical protein